MRYLLSQYEYGLGLIFDDIHELALSLIAWYQIWYYHLIHKIEINVILHCCKSFTKRQKWFCTDVKVSQRDRNDSWHVLPGNVSYRSYFRNLQNETLQFYTLTLTFNISKGFSTRLWAIEVQSHNCFCDTLL